MHLSEIAPTDDADAIDLIRTITDYDATVVAKTELEQHLRLAKLRLGNRVDSTEWYDDSGLGQALVYTAAIFLKGAVENYSVDSYSLGDIDIEVEDGTEEDKAQLQQWMRAADRGIQNSSVTGPQNRFSNTTSYIGGRPH